MKIISVSTRITHQPILTVQEKKELMERAKGEFLLLQNIRNEGWYKASSRLWTCWVRRIDYGDIDQVHLTDNPNDTIGIPESNHRSS